MQLISLQALGTSWHIELLDTSIDVNLLQKETQDFLECFESRYSRFRTDSWVSILNREKVFNNPDSEFVRLLNESLRYYHMTKRVFNIAIGERMEQSGYDSEYSFIEKISQAKKIPVLTDVLMVTDEKISLKEGKIDLGGIGKGFVIDTLAKHYREVLNLQSFVINGGGDIYATHTNQEPIIVTLAHPANRELSIGTVELCNQGFAASSPFVRAWKDKDTSKEQNHLHTNNCVASYVLADKACEADVWATTLAIDPAQTPKGVKRLLLKNSNIISADSIFKI